MFLRQQLYNLKIKEGSSSRYHFNGFNTMISRLAAIDVKIDDEGKVALLLYSMPNLWDGLIMNLSNCSNLII
ncbi:hypothetical protein PJP10_32620 [Mycobacterium kansasii]